MKPAKLSTKIFLDSGDPDETKRVLDMLGFLDGQTTNPSLVVKKLNRQSSVNNEQAAKISEDELLGEYRKIVEEVSALIPSGSVSIEVYADENTNADKMLDQGRSMYAWIPNAHIKFPTTHEGLKAAERAVSEGMRVNMTLVFSQEQAAAVYTATDRLRQMAYPQGKFPSSLPGFNDVFVSPFIGRLDDGGENGMDLIKNIAHMYKNDLPAEVTTSHVMVLSASIRNLDHFYGSIASGADIITCPINIYEAWKKDGLKIPDEDYEYDKKDLKPIEYKKFDLEKDWKEFDISHALTDAGLKKFADDWKSLIG